LTTPEVNSWKLIRDEVVRRINERIWRPGDLIPGEAELAEEFGCARATVNRALREVADAGLVMRRRKAGTRVTIHPARKARLSIPVVRLDVEKRGSAYRHALIEMKKKKPPPLLRSQLGLPDGRLMVYIRAMHFADGLPFIFEDRWINPQIVPQIETADFGAISPNEWLVLNAPFTHGDLAFYAANATAEEAELLETAEGTALFIAERTTWNALTPITRVRMAYAPGYKMVTTI
jgi:GntR family transcriptional regulator, histidine utilization repressor